jgi:hypothetical protein
MLERLNAYLAPLAACHSCVCLCHSTLVHCFAQGLLLC